MPGALNVPFSNVKYLDKSITTSDGQGLNRLKDKVELEDVFKRNGVDLHDFNDKRIVTTCGSGMTAALLYLALHVCGHDNKSLYDGSWTEYGDESKKLPYLQQGILKNNNNNNNN